MMCICDCQQRPNVPRAYSSTLNTARVTLNTHSSTQPTHPACFQIPTPRKLSDYANTTFQTVLGERRRGETIMRACFETKDARRGACRAAHALAFAFVLIREMPLGLGFRRFRAFGVWCCEDIATWLHNIAYMYTYVYGM